MGGGAQREPIADESQLLLTGTDGRSENALKQAVAERLAAHRSRRAAELANAEEHQAHARARAERARTETRRGASMVRDAVAARYERTQSYREFLAAEAERALQQAQAEAEVATRTMQAVAEAQQKLLDELAEYDRPQLVVSTPTSEVASPSVVRFEPAVERSVVSAEHSVISFDELEPLAESRGLSIVEEVEETLQPNLVPTQAVSLGSLSVRLPDELAAKTSFENLRQSHFIELSEEELAELEDEIAFRRDPEFLPIALESTPIPANIIEFPRELVAPRKARPRLAEGPLLEEAPAAVEPQLRIFEVEAEQALVIEQAPAGSHGAPEWQSLMLESYQPVEHPVQIEAQAQFTFQPQLAPMQRRAIAVVVDGLCVATGFLLFATTVAYISGPRLATVKLSALAGTAGLVWMLFYLAYQTLFFTLSDATPGMRYAKIALCTFGDDNPSRKAMRRRTLANVLAACPLGLGFAWILLDNDRLGWHDRISRMYQRAY